MRDLLQNLACGTEDVKSSCALYISREHLNQSKFMNREASFEKSETMIGPRVVAAGHTETRAIQEKCGVREIYASVSGHGLFAAFVPALFTKVGGTRKV